MLCDDTSHQPCSCWHVHGVVMLLQKNIQLSSAKPFSNSRSLFLIFANWHLRGVLGPRKHNSAPLSITSDTLVLIRDIITIIITIIIIVIIIIIVVVVVESLLSLCKLVYVTTVLLYCRCKRT